MDRHIECQHLTILPEWEEKINEEIDKLDTHNPGLMHHFRTTIIGTKHHHLGLFEMHLVASVPDDTIVVKHTGKRVRPLIVECFDALDREIREYNRIRQGKVKHHEEVPGPEEEIEEV